MTTKARSSASEPAAADGTPVVRFGNAEDLEQAFAALERRVENLERHTGAPAPDDAERDQVERDEEILSRPPTTYKEAVEQETARKRRAERLAQRGRRP